MGSEDILRTLSLRAGVSAQNLQGEVRILDPSQDDTFALLSELVHKDVVVQKNRNRASGGSVRFRSPDLRGAELNDQMPPAAARAERTLPTWRLNANLRDIEMRMLDPNIEIEAMQIRSTRSTARGAAAGQAGSSSTKMFLCGILLFL